MKRILRRDMVNLWVCLKLPGHSQLSRRLGQVSTSHHCADQIEAISLISTVSVQHSLMQLGEMVRDPVSGERMGDWRWPEGGRLSRPPSSSLLLKLDPGQQRRPLPWYCPLSSVSFSSFKRLQPACRPDIAHLRPRRLDWPHRTFLCLYFYFCFVGKARILSLIVVPAVPPDGLNLSNPNYHCLLVVSLSRSLTLSELDIETTLFASFGVSASIDPVSATIHTFC
ncbi:hypothetical protein QBC37DRAFT_80752 [Rhypophila decipiens]|uniref:Uncharacterized protein n=1 Tax=Rhypophila decipiens TaxID=261697 RepID=A0AAN6YCX5_9PEZI|nr:hypothetical protein QBC37DRAFT_80752 [Rhypophila decipiens]